MQSNEIEFIDVGMKLLVYAHEKQFSDKYLLSIGCPREVLEHENLIFEFHDWIDKQSDRCHLHIMKLMFEERQYNSVKEIKDSKLLKDLNLPLSDFWLEFLKNVKENFLRCEFHLTIDE